MPRRPAPTSWRAARHALRRRRLRAHDPARRRRRRRRRRRPGHPVLRQQAGSVRRSGRLHPRPARPHRQWTPTDVAEALLPKFFAVWEDDTTFVALLRAAMTSATAADTMREVFATQVAPVLTAVAPDHPAQRAGLMGAFIIGLATTRYVLTNPAVANLSHDELIRWAGPVIRQLLVGPAPADSGDSTPSLERVLVQCAGLPRGEPQRRGRRTAAGIYEPLTRSVRELIDATIRTEVDARRRGRGEGRDRRRHRAAPRPAARRRVRRPIRQRRRPDAVGQRRHRPAQPGRAAAGPSTADARRRRVRATSISARPTRVRPVTCTAASRPSSSTTSSATRRAQPDKPRLTGTITLRYRRITPLGDLHAEARIVRTEGVKTYAVGHLADAGRRHRRGRGRVHPAAVGARLTPVAGRASVA